MIGLGFVEFCSAQSSQIFFCFKILSNCTHIIIFGNQFALFLQIILNFVAYSERNYNIKYEKEKHHVHREKGNWRFISITHHE